MVFLSLPENHPISNGLLHRGPISFCLMFSVSNLLGQTNRVEDLKILLPCMPDEHQNDIVVLVGGLLEDSEKPQPCPPAYTNLLSNTNLFSSSEAGFIKGIIQKYKNITTNAGPVGSVFKEWRVKRLIRPRIMENPTNVFRVALFVYTNSNAREEIAAFFNNHLIMARYRNSSEDGYDVMLYDEDGIVIEQYKNGVLDGLFLGIHNPINQNRNDEIRCSSLLRLERGKAVGKFFGWDEDGKILIELEFKKPFDFINYQDPRTRVDFSWMEMSTNTTRAAHSPK